MRIRKTIAETLTPFGIMLACRFSFPKFARSPRRLRLCAVLTAALTFVAASSARAATFNISNGDVAALISAIRTANSNGQDDTIELASNGTYTLTVSYSGSDGLPVISPDGGKKLTIHGNGSTIQRDYNASQPFRILRCAKGADVRIFGLTISGGFLYHPDFGDGTELGGGIYNDGTLALTQCSIVGNGITIDPYGGSGGGILNNGSLTISNSEVSGNQAWAGSGITSGGTLTITNSSIDSNSNATLSGGWAISNGGSATITNSSISGNEADNAIAAGIINSGSMQLTNCSISGNHGRFSISGGAIYNYSSLRMTNCTMNGNYAQNTPGGAIYNDGGGTLILENSTLSWNNTLSHGAGGAIYNLGSLTVMNCTLSGNEAGISDSFLEVLDNGGGIYNAGSLTVRNSTFSDNAATSGGGGAVHNSGNSAVAKIANTIFKTGRNGANLGNDSGGSITSLGYNLSNDNGGGFLTATDDRINTDPMLGPLQDNGGPTFTQELLLGSPAIDAGDPTFNPNSFSPPLLYDERGAGFTRIVNGRVDIGAFELQAQRFETEKLALQALQGATHSIFSDANLSGSAGTQLNATGNGQYVTYTVPVLTAGTYKVKVGVKTGPNRGTFKLLIGGVAQGTAQDEYRSTIGYGVRDLGTVTFFSGGDIAFKFLVSGKNANSGGYSLAFDYIELIPTARLEAESLTVQSITPPPVGTNPFQWSGVFSGAAASGGAGTYFNANAVGNYITYTVPVVKAGTYRLRVGIQTRPNKGIFQLTINGTKQGPTVDEYSPSTGYAAVDLGTVAFFNSGNQSLTFTVKGHNAASTGYTLAFDYIELIPTNRQEAESLTVQSFTPGVARGVFSGSGATAASGGAGTFFNANAIGNYITYTVPVVKAGTYQLRVGIQTRPNKGIFQLAINGLNVGQPQDEYYPSTTYVVRDLGTVSFSVAGNYAFKFTVTGKNASSTGYTLAFDYIELIPK